MTTTTIIGIVASVFTGISLFPQLVKLVKEKKASDISMLMLVTLLGGLILWIVYGSRKNDPVIIISNAVSLLLNVAIVFLNMYYKNKRVNHGHDTSNE